MFSKTICEYTIKKEKVLNQNVQVKEENYWIVPNYCRENIENPERLNVIQCRQTVFMNLKKKNRGEK